MKNLKLIPSIFALLFALYSPSFVYSDNCSEEGFIPLFNGESWDGWYLKIKSGDHALAQKVFAIEDGEIHAFNSSFPDEYELDGDNNTHGMAYTKKSYSKYILRFDYKWGTRKANNFNKWQYDAGVYFHVVDDKIWPNGIEYQVRYDHTKERNHTGDLIGTDYLWFPSDATKEATFLHPHKGGKAQKVDGWMHLASPTDNFYALDGKWNQCEIVVMADAYVIQKLNGEVVNIARELKFDKGIIGFQVETAEIFYRNIEIKEFDQIVPMEDFLKD